MDTLAPSFSVTRNDDLREIYYTISGLFTLGTVNEMFAELSRVAQPFVEDRKGFRVLGDLRGFSVQTREVVEKIQLSQDRSAKVGGNKMAILYSSVLVKQQFRRVSDALELGMFENKAEALIWLRAD